MRASKVLDQHRQAIRAVGERYREKGITNLRVFGSVVDGTDTDSSDIDFLVDAEKHVSLFTIGGLYSDLEDILKRKIDLVLSDEVPSHLKATMFDKAKAV